MGLAEANGGWYSMHRNEKKGEVGSETTVMPKTGSDSGRKMLAGFVSKSMI